MTASDSMSQNKLFYYPYAYFTSRQMPLLKVAALYFDKLYLLDPVGATSGTIGADHFVRDAVKELQSAGIAEPLSPGDVLAKYSTAITNAIREDMADGEFLKLCEGQGRGNWRLALAKVPEDLKTDQSMRHLMGDFAREMAVQIPMGDDANAPEFVQYDETETGELLAQHQKFREYREARASFQTGTHYTEGYDNKVEYRYADFPLPVGEAIMVNHALFTGLIHADATPVTDDPFHHQVLSLKMRRTAQNPKMRQVLADRVGSRKVKADLVAIEALSDSQLRLPVLNPELPLAEVLEYRHAHGGELQEARDKLGRMARRIQAEPWSQDFVKELDSKTIPDITDELEKVRRTRDDWLASKRGRLALSAGGLVVGAAAAVLAVIVMPLTPVAVATAGLGFVSGTIIPGAEWLLDWRDGKKTSQENGLHYFLSYD